MGYRNECLIAPNVEVVWLYLLLTGQAWRREEAVYCKDARRSVYDARRSVYV